MTDEDFTKIESALGITLPDEYRNGMYIYPLPQVIDELIDTPDAVIGANKAYRKGSFFGEEWSPVLLVLGTNGTEDLYYLDTSMMRGSWVYRIDHETHKRRPVASSFDEWIDELKRQGEEDGWWELPEKPRSRSQRVRMEERFVSTVIGTGRVVTGGLAILGLVTALEWLKRLLGG